MIEQVQWQVGQVRQAVQRQAREQVGTQAWDEVWQRTLNSVWHMVWFRTQVVVLDPQDQPKERP